MSKMCCILIIFASQFVINARFADAWPCQPIISGCCLLRLYTVVMVVGSRAISYTVVQMVITRDYPAVVD